VVEAAGIEPASAAPVLFTEHGHDGHSPPFSSFGVGFRSCLPHVVVGPVPNRTTEMAHRDKRTNRLRSPLNGPVSGSESNDLNRQDPANSRAFPDPSSDLGGKSLHPQTGWRWGESRANSSLEEIPVQQGKYREILQNLMLLAESELSFLSISMAVATDSL